jgi:uncharacterized membrane protein
VAQSKRKPRRNTSRRNSSRRRIVVMAAAGVVAAVATGLLDLWQFAAIVGWAAACLVYVGWVWLSVGRLDAAGTKESATREDPTRGVADVLALLASVASLAAVITLLIQGQNAHGAAKVAIPILAIVSILLSWFLVHTLFMLRYAKLYYVDDNGGVNFNQDEPPQYTDFAYLAFTLGATFQVSDTNIEKHNIRVTVLRHALLSYLFGSVILAATVNLVAGLAH